MTEQQIIAPPPMPEAAPVVPAPSAPLKKDRRVLRAVLRWTAAAIVFAAVGTSAAYGITRMERTDVPGLATESDGRWDYPEIERQPLPKGSPGPFDGDNPAGTHFADLRKLVLPAPEGAKPDPALRGEDGWLARKAFLGVYEDWGDREELGQLLTDYGLRHIAARGWTAQDGTRTRVYLLQFDTAVVTDDVRNELAGFEAPKYELRGASDVRSDDGHPAAANPNNVRRFSYTENKPYGKEQVRQAYLTAGDTLALVVQSRAGSAAAVPFHQTVTLQMQLLG
ncbi:hypothetical protein ACIQNU_33700 [Streptomyces sp. NPDC091292]|uniref:hypothetical protein n=1 Tax=Streptomyces sp. NPDC091292 TaxID=3365991 RepID=UPI00380A7BA2